MTVALVGAGPGDPELITVRGLERLRRCDAVVYDRLVAPELVDEAPPDALRIPRDGLGQERIDGLLVHLGRQGLDVVRLKGGDPYLFGRGGEEALALAAAGVPFEVVPGVSSLAAVPAAADIPSRTAASRTPSRSRPRTGPTARSPTTGRWSPRAARSSSSWGSAGSRRSRTGSLPRGWRRTRPPR